MFFIFLDIDGVLNTKDSWRIPYSIKEEKVELIATLTKKFDAKIVLISTWKKGFDKNDENCTSQILKLKNYFRKYHIEIEYKTIDLINQSRDKEIERFLYYHPTNNYVILDDDESLFNNKKNLYLVNYNTGITKSDIKKIYKKYKKYKKEL